jgi:hypothetical protein
MDNSIDAMKRWYFFKEGSTWDYQDQFSGAVDHVVVSDYVEEYYSDGRFYLRVLLYSSYYNFYWVLETSDEGYTYLKSDPICQRIRIIESRGEVNTFVFPSNVGDLYKDYQWRTVNEFYNTSVGTNVTFAKVLRMVHPFYDNGYAEAYTEMYLAEGVGVVRMHRPGQNEDWCLIDYNIVE